MKKCITVKECLSIYGVLFKFMTCGKKITEEMSVKLEYLFAQTLNICIEYGSIDSRWYNEYHDMFKNGEVSSISDYKKNPEFLLEIAVALTQTVELDLNLLPDSFWGIIAEHGPLQKGEFICVSSDIETESGQFITEPHVFSTHVLE